MSLYQCIYEQVLLMDTCSILFVCYYSLVRCYDSTMYIIVLLSYHVLIDMPSVSGDTGGWIPYCSHDPIVVAIKSSTPTHRYDEHMGVYMVVCIFYLHSLPFGAG